jgi:protein gp37
VSDDLLNQLFHTIEHRRDVTFQILTKRPQRMQKYLSWRWGEGRIPSRHIHLGTSVENQAAAALRIPHLLATPAAIRFLSCEPLIGPVDLFAAMRGPCPECGHDLSEHAADSRVVGCKHGTGTDADPICGCRTIARDLLHWVICGGESGPGHRDCDPAWIASLVAQCEAVGVPVFVKQSSGPRPGTQGRIPLDVWKHKDFPEEPSHA